MHYDDGEALQNFGTRNLPLSLYLVAQSRGILVDGAGETRCEGYK